MWATEVPQPPTTLTLVCGQIMERIAMSRGSVVRLGLSWVAGLDRQDLGRLTSDRKYLLLLYNRTACCAPEKSDEKLQDVRRVLVL